MTVNFRQSQWSKVNVMIAENIMQDRPVDTRKAAEFLGVTESTLIQRRFRRMPPEYLKIGKCVRYLPSKLIEYRERCQVKPACDAA